MTDLRKVADTLEMTIPYLPAKTATLSEVEETIEELRQAFAQPEQEPVAWMSDHDVDFKKSSFGTYPCVPLYTAPPKREWVGLTDDEICKCAGIDGGDTWIFETAYAITAKLKEKNT